MSAVICTTLAVAWGILVVAYILLFVVATDPREKWPPTDRPSRR